MGRILVLPHSRRGQTPLWPCLVATACLIAPPCLGISLLSIKRVWRRSGRYAQKDVLARKPFPSPGGLFDRTDQQWIVIDVDGTRQAARQRALPQAENLPTPHRRLDQVCAPGYQGRKRGEVVRTRTVVLQAHTHQFLGTFGGPGNGDYRSELRRAIQVITNYATQLALPLASVLLRLDGLYGDAAPLLDVLTAGLGILARSRAYHLLDLSVVQQALACPP